MEELQKECIKIILLLSLMFFMLIGFMVFSGAVIYNLKTELDNTNNIHYTHK